MGVVILGLSGTASLRIGATRHTVGRLTRLWKVTETDLGDDCAEFLDAIDDAGRNNTPEAVIVEGDGRVLGWDAGRLRTQDMDWDHLPTLGYAVTDADGEAVLHEARDGPPVTAARAQELGILSEDGRLLGRGQPTIVACYSVEGMPGGYYAAACEFEDGRAATVLGESESGDPPPSDWLVGQTPKDAATYRLASQTAAKRGAG